MKTKNKGGAVVKAPTSKAVGVLDQSNPVAMVEGATVIANELSRIIKDQVLYATISGRKHVKVEGWTTLGAMSGVFPYVEYARRLKREDPTEITYEARVLARTRSGEVIGAAEALASNKELTTSRRTGKKIPRWEDEYAVKSMAQTRATSKALRLPLGWIMTLSGFDATPAEEIPEEGFNDSIEVKGTVSQGSGPNPVKTYRNIKKAEKAKEAVKKEAVIVNEDNEEIKTTDEDFPHKDDAVILVDKVVDQLLAEGHENIVEVDIIERVEAMPKIRGFQVLAVKKYLGVENGD